MLYSMHFQNLGIHQKTKTLDTFKLAIAYDTAVTTLCQSLVSPASCLLNLSQRQKKPKRTANSQLAFYLNLTAL